jgi:hypothetical protein
LVVLDVSQHRPKLVVWTIRRGSAAKVNPRVVNPPSLHPPSHPVLARGRLSRYLVPNIPIQQLRIKSEATRVFGRDGVIEMNGDINSAEEAGWPY